MDKKSDNLGENFLNNLEIYGYEEYSPFVLYSLITGMPILLVGPHGTGKTLLAERVAKLLGTKFHAYDASKAMFEDIVGFPNPETMKKGSITYIQGELTLWDKEFILVDEISRALPSNQNKWLEVIRSRRLMGISLNKLNYIFAAMNPPSYAGAMPLDEALADRFAFILNINGKSNKYIDKIIEVQTHEDSPLIIEKNGLYMNSDFTDYLDKKRKEFKKLLKDDKNIAKLIIILNKLWDNNNLYISPRRWKMLYYNVLGITLIKGELTEKLFISTITNSLPFYATTDEMTLEEENKLNSIIIQSYKIFREDVPLEEIEEPSGDSITMFNDTFPFSASNTKELMNFMEIIFSLSKDWENTVKNEGRSFLWILKELIDNSSLSDFDLQKVTFEHIYDMPEQFWALLSLLNKIHEKYGSNSMIDMDDEMFEQILSKFVKEVK